MERSSPLDGVAEIAVLGRVGSELCAVCPQPVLLVEVFEKTVGTLNQRSLKSFDLGGHIHLIPIFPKFD